MLKLNAMYGANGAGKSNLIKSLSVLKKFLTEGKLPIELITETFKFDSDSRKKDIYLGVEFIKDDVPYYYGITINQGVVVEEELQISGLGKKEDKNLFLRTDNVDAKQLSISFSEQVMQDKEAALFPQFLQNEVLERDKPVLYYLRNRNNPVFDPFRKVFDWFDQDLVILSPSTRLTNLILLIETDENFCKFALDIMKSFKTGVKEIKVKTLPIEDFFGEDDKDKIDTISTELKANPETIKILSNDKEIVLVVLKDRQVVAKRLYFLHDEDGGITHFSAKEESDGTRRLLDYIPAVYSIVNSRKVYIIDEIERSIHPLLIKELIRKFSQDETTKGQLIFTTHESNLLDQDIFRPDEIWFAEKKPNGSTELYVLSEFKEHHTKDIRKGYLNGRYGAIPFLSNLQDLKWDKYAEAQ
ncbi:MAG: ATP-binding protein [Haliscomenobacter sp.]|uniref:AAA family ATPase n=1 Tax=Haliscomenobacter sp. TaxID=2717303 RepID=UPI0029A70E9C|nr:ATP-binding protein [Haliscomenobacter sp.]MDX2066890.1 ATP-binding protein [Haliscomenobacter sp.]